MKEKFIALLTFTSSLRNFGTKFIRVAILVVFVWIGGLKYFHYEADGIVPFVANSPFMSFFYAKEAPEYKNFKNPEGALVPRKPCMARSEQHIYFLLRTGSAYHEYRYSGVLGHLLPQSGTGGRFARYHHDARYTFVPRHHAGGLGTQPGERRIRFPVTVRCRTAGD